MEITKENIIDILNKWQFLLGQRSGRELWMDKPTKIQEEDLANFNRDLETVRSFVDLQNISCSKCKHLKIINNGRVYAKCTRTGLAFEPFMTDTRRFFCAWFEKDVSDPVEKKKKETVIYELP